MDRRLFTQQIALAGLALAALPAAGAETAFPVTGRPVRLIVSLPAGGGVDIVARRVGQHLAERLGVPVNIDNRPGAFTLIAVQELMRATPDGHTLLVNPAAFISLLPHQMDKLPYDPWRDLTPVAPLFRSALVLAAHPSLPASDAKGLIEYARNNPGKLNYASWSPGGINHIYPELLKRRFGLEMTHVPYNGIVKVHPDLVENRVQMVLDATAQGFEYIRSGRLKAIGIMGSARIARLPEVPTFKEQGVDGFDWSGTVGLFAPAGTPAVVVEKLNRHVAAVLAMAEVQRTFALFSYDAVSASPREYADELRADSERWGPILRELGIRLD